MKKILSNIICCFIPSRNLRRRIRLEMNVPVRKYTKFAKSFSSSKHPRVKYTYGYRCGNFVVNIDDKFVFKFPREGDAWDVALREKRITDALKPVCPIKIPDMEILDLDGIAVRKYEYVKGIGFHSLDKKTKLKYANKIGKQLADFLYAIGTVDPKEIREYKQKKSDKPSIMHGWTQTDLWDNFLLDEKTFDIVAAIDWETVGFDDFYTSFTHGSRNSIGQAALLREYLKLWIK